jgi:hypothetical protein
MASTANLDPPLADYFWIAGIDSTSYGEHLARGGAEAIRKSFADQLLVAAMETEEETQGISLHVPSTNGRRSNGGQFSGDRLSIHGETGGSGGGGITTTTIDVPPTPTNATRPKSPGGLMRNSSNSSNSTITESRPLTTATVRRDFDFDKALLKFAAERDSFLEDLSFSAGTVLPKREQIHPRAQKVLDRDEPMTPVQATTPNNRLEKTNSLRRRISLRDLTSMRRSPSVVNRACKY